MGYKQNECPTQEDFAIYGTEFTTATEYQNKFLTGRYRLEMRGLGTMIRKVEWDYLEDGGFKILIPSFTATPDVIIIGKFY